MKKITLFYFVLFCTIVNAQMTTKLDTIQNVDKLIKPLNKTDFKTNILYDRVVSIAKLTDFNNKKNESTLAHFEQALSELYRASKKSKFTSVTNFRKKFTSVVLKNSVDIGIINTTFNQLNYDEKENTKGALKLKKGKLIPINNKPLFLEKHLLVIAPLKKYGVGQEITYNFKEAFLLQETDTKIVTLTASFGTQKTYTIINNGKLLQQSIHIRYTESGHKTLQFTATFNDDTRKTTKGKLFITASNTSLNRNPDDGIENGTITATIPFTGYEAGDVPIYGQLEYRIFYHGTPNNYERILKKPIVIIDGFDPFDERKIQESDYPNDGEEHPDAIETLMSYKEGVEDIPLIEKLRLLGYDVVIVNHPIYDTPPPVKTIDGGADYIERNAMAHIALYQYLNQKVFDNGSSEELTIMGPSMGGQISRYALAYMEQHNLDHNTKLWVSIDSPHLGANIPISVQASIYFLGYITGEQQAKDQYDHLLNSPAGKQQLLIQHSYNSTSLPPYFQQYHTNLESNLPTFKGFPQIPRNIAIVNGSLTKNTNYASQKVLDIRAFGHFSFIKQIKGFQIENWFMKGTGGRNKVFYGFKRNGLSTVSMTSNFTNPLVYGAMDNLQGGMANAHGDLKDEIVINLQNNNLVDNYSVRTYISNHSFVPTVSGLAFKNQNFKWNEPIDPNLICSDMIPFDTFYAPRYNQDHIYFTQTSVDWLFEELAGNHQSPPSNTYIKPTITGDPEVYTGQTVTYTIPKVAKATSYTWDLDFNYNTTNYTPWTLISGQGTRSITVRAGSPIIGYISCRPRNSCGASQLSYKAVRSYNTSGGGGGGDDDPCDNNYKLSISPNPNKGDVLTVTLAPDYPTDPCDDINPFKQQIKNTIEIYDMYGAKKYSGIYNSNDISITGLRLKMGVYVVHLTTVNGVKKEKMLMIE
ncbi:MAG: hypothetical protein PSN34_10550 [Urechidicola sp.]|nr:hypothetical protein [Urechidicola sp.]